MATEIRDFQPLIEHSERVAFEHFVFGPGAFRLIINYNKKNKKWKPRHLREEDVNKYEKPCQVASATYIDSREKTNTIYNLWISSRVNPVI